MVQPALSPQLTTSITHQSAATSRQLWAYARPSSQTWPNLRNHPSELRRIANSQNHELINHCYFKLLSFGVTLLYGQTQPIQFLCGVGIFFYNKQINENLVWINDESIYYEPRIAINPILCTWGSFKNKQQQNKTHLFTWWLYQPANYFPYLEFFAPCVRLLIDNPFQPSIHSTTKSSLTSLRGSDVCRFQVILIKTVVLYSLLSSPSQFLKMARAGKSQIPFLRTNLPC